MFEKVFKLKEHNTKVSTELLGGLTTFLAMAYILFVNSNILKDAGMNETAVFAATALAAVVSCLVMGLYANLPIGLAPGMGMNAFFAYVIVLKYGYSWQEALAATLIAGIIFTIISATGLRKIILKSIPEPLKIAVAVGIGFFITFIGLQEAGIIVSDKATLIALGDLTQPATLLALFGLALTIILMVRKVKGAVFLGIIGTAVVGVVSGLAPLPTGFFKVPITELGTTFGVAITSISSFLTTGSIINVILIVFVILFVAFFDAAGTIVSVTRAAGLVDSEGEIKNGGRAFMADSLATVFGAIFGTSSTTSYIESLAGISVGARTGLAAIFTGLFFLIFMFFSPLLSIIIPAVTAPALIIVGSLMAKEVSHIDFDDFPVAIGAFLTMLLIVLSYNISKGLAFGFLIYTLAMVVAGRFKEIPKAIYVLDIFFIIMLFFTQQEKFEVNLMKNTQKNLKTLIDTAMNRQEADLVIKNVDIVDVFNNSIVKGDIAIVDGFIAGIGNHEGKATFDGKGMYACPGFIDSHVHIESSMATPLQFAKSVVPRGTTSIIADPHEIANVQGLEGIEYILSEGEKISFLDIYVMLPSCVPATPFEDSGAVLQASDLEKPKERERVLGLGEMMNFPGTINADKDVLDKLSLFKGQNIDGHAPLLKDKALGAYVAAGVKTDHECTNVEEMTEKISLGMYVLIREGSAARDCSVLVKGITKDNNRRVMFCTDDRHPEDILNYGHIDNNVNIAIREGIDPIDAIKIASLNACECYGLRDKGAIAPGYIADILLFDSLNDIKADVVFKSGRLVAQNGEMAVSKDSQPGDKASVKSSVNFKKFKKDRFKIFLEGNRVRVIELLENTLLTNMLELEVSKDENNNFVTSDDLLKVAVVERHNALDKIGLGVVKGYGLKNGAIATSVSHDSHNIIVVGDNDDDMYLAVNRIQEINGGIVLVKDGKVIGELPLPIGGLMSDLSLKEIDNHLRELNKLAYRELKTNRSLDPFISLSFLALPVIPNIKITDQGLFDVMRNTFVDLEIKGI